MNSDKYSDENDLIRACAIKDHEAWECFIRRYDGLILTSIGKRLRKYGIYPNAHDIKEMQQIIITSLWEGDRLSGIKDPRSLRYWLAALSGNMALDYIRKKARLERLMPVSLHDIIESGEIEDILPAVGRAVSDQLANSEIAERLDKAIESLPVNEKLAVQLALIHGKKHKEVACIMGVPRGTAFSYIRKAKKKLQKSLADLQ